MHQVVGRCAPDQRFVPDHLSQVAIPVSGQQGQVHFSIGQGRGQPGTRFATDGHLDPRVGSGEPGEDPRQELQGIVVRGADAHLPDHLRLNHGGHGFFVQLEHAPGIGRELLPFGGQ